MFSGGATAIAHGAAPCRPLACPLPPQPIAWGATFDPALVRRAASEVGDEMRAYNNAEMRAGRPPDFSNCFGPHVNIVRSASSAKQRQAGTTSWAAAGAAASRPQRPAPATPIAILLRTACAASGECLPHGAACRDPRWGRLSETFGEDPRLSADMAQAFVSGLQGGNGSGAYLKAGATCKVRRPAARAPAQRAVGGAAWPGRSDKVRQAHASRPALSPLALLPVRCPHRPCHSPVPLPCSTLSATTWRTGGASPATTSTPPSTPVTCATPSCRHLRAACGRGPTA